jgi:hypothetical protein
MKVEVIDFYPLERNEEKGYLSGTLRIKLPDIGIHILGIFVSKTKNRWYFTLPGRKGTHHETGEEVRYPFIVFEDCDKQKELIAAIREEGRTFIERKLLDKANSLIFPEKKQQLEEKKNQKPALGERTSDHTVISDVDAIDKAHPKPLGKEFVINANSNQASKDVLAKPQAFRSIATKEWIDPPKRKDKCALKQK